MTLDNARPVTEAHVSWKHALGPRPRRAANNPARSDALVKKAATAPLPGIREPGPYARDQGREETRTPGQQGKKRAAGFAWRLAPQLALNP
jgi:hypothetical protein